MLLAAVAAVSRAVATTPARRGKVALLADAIRAAGPADVRVVVTYLTGELPQRRTGLGYAALRERPPGAGRPALHVRDVDATFSAIAAATGTGSTTQRRRRFTALLADATPPEQDFLVGLVAGNLRQGALEGLMTDAVATAAALPPDDVRRAVMLAGSVAEVAEAALADGMAGLARFRLVIGRPIQPMLAQTASSVGEALGRLGRAAVEWKLDGVRIQVHKDGSDVAVFTRTLDDVTSRLPEVTVAVMALPIRTAVLDGEAIALHEDGHPRRFQETASRIATRATTTSTPLAITPFVFDVLHLDGADLLDSPGNERYAVARDALPAGLLVPRVLTDDVAAAAEFYDDTLARGHEGVVVKALDTPYQAGRRGGGWLKVKPVHTLDLVVLAAEWGSGRRRGWLSNLHLGARDPGTGEFVMLGKTFKGLTDELLRWQTDALLARAIDRSDWVVRVRPELVVEIAFDGVQTSSRYPGGVALRFARVVRYRPDKTASEADTIESVRRIHDPG